MFGNSWAELAVKVGDVASRAASSAGSMGGRGREVGVSLVLRSWEDVGVRVTELTGDGWEGTTE